MHWDCFAYAKHICAMHCDKNAYHKHSCAMQWLCACIGIALLMIRITALIVSNFFPILHN